MRHATRRALPALVLGLLLSACATTERPSVARTDDMGHTTYTAPSPWRWTREGGSIDQPAGSAPAADAPVVWQWTVEAGPGDARASAADGPLPGGLRVGVATAAPTVVRAEAHAIEEGKPAAILVGFTAWPADAWPATEQSGWAGAEIRVEWLVEMSPRGSCAVAVEAVPRIQGGAPCPVLLEEYRFRRTVQVGETIVLSTDASGRATRVANALVGAKEGKGGAFLLHVKP